MAASQWSPCGSVSSSARLFTSSSSVFNCAASEQDSWDGLSERLPRCPLTPSLSPRKRTTSQSKTEPPLLRTSKRTIYTAGRPPWYNVTGTTFKEAFVIGEAPVKRDKRRAVSRLLRPLLLLIERRLYLL